MHILVADHESPLQNRMQAAFEANGYQVTVTGSGDEAVRQVAMSQSGLLVLDVHTGGRDGWAVLESIRRAGLETPVLLLGDDDHVDVDDRVRGFDLGADGYLSKPFDLRELLGLDLAIVRRCAVRAVRIVAADMELAIDSRTAIRSRQRLDLSPHEFHTLLLLVRSNGTAVSRDEMCR